jgi:PAS domain S-box-containing protein
MTEAGPGCGLQRQRWRWLENYALAVAVVAATFALRLALAPVCGNRVMLNLFSLPVLLCAYMGGVGPGLLAMALVTLSVVFFLPSGFHFGSLTTADAIMLAMFVVTNLVMLALVEALHRVRRRLEQTVAGQEQAAAALRESESHYRLLAEHTEDFVSVHDAQERRLFISPSYYRRTGWTPEDLQNSPWDARLHPEELPAIQQARAANRAGQMTLLEHRIRCRNGDWLWIESRSKPILDAGGQLQQLVIWSHDITERKRADAALDGERQLLRTLINNLPDLIFTKDMAARFIISNTAHVSFMGVPTEAALAGKTVLDLHPEELARGYYEDDLRVMHTGQAIINREELVQDHAGVRRWFLTIKAPLRDLTGKITGLVSVCRDITERRRAEAELRARERLLREVIDLVPHHIFAKNHEGRFLFVNRAGSLCYGREPRDLVGHLEREFASDQEQAAAFLRDDQAVIASGQARFIPEEPITFADGSVHWLQTTKMAFVPPGATERAVMGVAVDITERKQAERALVASEEKFRRSAANIDDVLYSVDAATREFIYVSPAFEQLLGYTLADVYRLGGRRAFLAQVIQGGRFADQERLMNSLLTPHPACLADRWETWWRCRDGSLKCMEDHWIAVYDGDRLVATEGVLRNITERKRLEAQVQQAQKMEAVGQLAGGVAHDFNNILQSILGFTEILLADTPPADRHHGDLLEIQKSAERAAGLTRQLLAFSRRQMITPTVLDLNGVVSNMHKLLHRLLGEDIQLVTELAADLPRIKADAGQIEQIIMNLAINARDAMPRGGRITLTTASVVLTAEDIPFIADGRAGQFVRLSLADTGTGIAPDVLPHIFEPFFSTTGPGKGTGLGLSVIYGIAQQHNGWVNVYSQLGQGTAFKLYLPVYAGAEEGSAPAVRPTPAPPRGHGERLLLIEDEPEVRNLATRILGAAGYEVFAAGTSAEGCALFDREHGRFDLVFSDVVLPDQNGITTVEQLLHKKPGLAVLLCSGYTDQRSRWQAIAEKKFPFLQKPYPATELLQTIHALLDARGAPPA